MVGFSATLPSAMPVFDRLGHPNAQPVRSANDQFMIEQFPAPLAIIRRYHKRQAGRDLVRPDANLVDRLCMVSPGFVIVYTSQVVHPTRLHCERLAVREAVIPSS